MPHVDGALSSPAPGLAPFAARPGQAPWAAHGESRFARPVAAITAFVRHALAAAAPSTVDCETRQHEAGYAHATDVHDLERMQRDDDRRDVRPWGWR
ncbi:MAG: hypothetical protein U1F10_13300 [Burkholderiales bacterium]